MLNVISKAEPRRSLRAIVFSIVAMLILVFAADNALGAPSDSTDFKMVKFVIQPETGQIVIGQEGPTDFHELLAADLNNVEATGYVKGEFMWSDGKPVAVNFNTEHVEGSDLNRKWTDDFIKEFILEHFAGKPGFEAFHGAAVTVFRLLRSFNLREKFSIGFFDFHQGVTSEAPHQTAAAADVTPDSNPHSSERPEPEPTEREVQPGPVEPDLEAKIENFLRSLDLQKLAADRDAGNLEIFKNPLFARESGEAGDKVARTWKKVCSKSEFSKHSGLLAELRWKMLVGIFSEIAQAHGIKLQLIDSGKRNAYRSDIDLTVYAPGDSGNGKRLAAVIAESEGRLKAMTAGHGAQSFDITIHNGALFAPNIRNSEQSVQEYTSQLHEVVGKLRLKVQSNGDASYFPGAQLEDAQKRGMRDGVVTELTPEVEVVSRAADGTPTQTRFKKAEPKEFRAAEIGPNGEIIAKSERFAGEPLAYDRNNALSALAQSLEKVFRNGDKPGDLAKLFNRGMNLGAGAGEVNNFMDIHVSDLPSGDNLSPEEAARLAIETERAIAELAEAAKDKSTREAKLNQLNELTSKGRNKAVAKMRWIMRSFRYKAGGQDQAALTKKLLSLYDLLNTSAAIEIDKGKANFDWNKDRARYLERYVEKLKTEMPELAKTPKGTEKLHDEAYRAFCDDVVKTLEEALVTLEVEALRDLTPDRIERFRRKGGGPAQGEGARLEQIAKKLAEQRRVELALLLDVINTYSDKTRPDSLTMNQTERLEKLRARILNAIEEVDPDVAEEAKKLSRQFAAMKEESLAEFTATGKPPTTTEEAIAAREEAAKRLAEVGPEAANSQVNEQSLREYIKDELRKIYNPADGPFLQQMFDALEQGLGGSITNVSKELTAGEKQYGTPGGALAETLKANLSSPLMIGSSVVTMGRAYVTGGERALKEAAIGEAFLFLPPVYGVIGIAFKDFSRGHVAEGAKSLAWLAGIHFGDQFIPGFGQALLVYNIVTGVPEIIYTYTTEKINSDMVEQALRSQRVQGKRAERNPFKDSTDLFRGDTPEFPIFWDNPCMKETDDNLTIEQRVPRVSALYSSQIARDLMYWGLKPEEVRAIEKAKEQERAAGVPSKPYENPNLKRFSPKWYEEQYRLLRKYAFDHPYYQRMGKIYECFYPQVKGMKDKGFDEDNVLKSVFGKEVEKWFSKQPPGYQMEFAFDVGRQTEHGDETRKRLLGAITNQVIAEYRKNEYETFRKIETEQAARAVQERIERLKKAIKQMIATQKIGGDRLQQKLENRILAALRGSPKEVAAQVQVKAPTWYVNMSGVLKTQTSYTLNNGKLVAGGEGKVSGEEKKDGGATPADGGYIPVDVAARVDRAKYSGEDALKHDFRLALAGPIKKEKPASFIPNAEESKLLAEVGPDGKPKNDIYTINLVATATVYGNQGQLIGQSKPAPIVGYVIAEVPRFSGQIAVRVRASVTDSRERTSTSIEYEAQIDKEVKRGRTSNDVRMADDAKFENLKAGTYQVTVTPLSPEFGSGTATFTLNDLYTKAAYETGNQPKNPDSVEVILPYKGLDAANKPQGPVHQPGQGGDQTASGKDAIKPGGKKPGEPGDAGGETQKVVQACQQLASQAQQLITAGDLASGAKLLQQAKQKGCKGLDPSVDQAIAGAQGNLDNHITSKAEETRQQSAQCEYGQALGLAQQLMRTSPGHPALAGINLAQLQAQAQAQRSARVLLEAGRAASERGDLDGAIAALQSAMSVPSLPDCMRQPITNLLGELKGRKEFGNLSPLVARAIDRCDTKEGVRVVGLIANIRPRTEIMQAWLDENIPKVAERQNAERDANRLLDQARAAAKAARPNSTFDRQQIFIWVHIAKQKVAPCELKLDPILVPFSDRSALDSPTDEVPGALDPNKNQTPTDEVPGALGTDKGDKETPTDEVPAALGDGGFWERTKAMAADVTKALGDDPGFWERTKSKATDDVPTALGGSPAKTKPGSKENPTDEVPGALGSDEQPGTKKEKKPRDPTGGGTGGSGGTTGGGSGSGGRVDLTGTWENFMQPQGKPYWRYQMVLRPAGTNTWEGSITLDTNSPPSVSDFYRNRFTGSVTIRDVGKDDGGTHRIHITFQPKEGTSEQYPEGILSNNGIYYGSASFNRK